MSRVLVLILLAVAAVLAFVWWKRTEKFSDITPVRPTYVSSTRGWDPASFRSAVLPGDVLPTDM